MAGAGRLLVLDLSFDVPLAADPSVAETDGIETDTEPTDPRGAACDGYETCDTEDSTAMTTPQTDQTGSGTTPSIAHGWFSDARMAAQVAKQVYAGTFIFVRGLGWHQWTGTRWKDCGDGPPTEGMRAFVVARIKYWGGKIGADSRADGMLDNWKKLASANRITAVMKLARNLVSVEIERLDADRDLINTPGGIVDLVTGAVTEHDPSRLMTKITRGSYRPGYSHPDVDSAVSGAA